MSVLVRIYCAQHSKFIAEVYDSARGLVLAGRGHHVWTLREKQRKDHKTGRLQAWATVVKELDRADWDQLNVGCHGERIPLDGVALREKVASARLSGHPEKLIVQRSNDVVE
jgi:hypothetical protein